MAAIEDLSEQFRDLLTQLESTRARHSQLADREGQVWANIVALRDAIRASRDDEDGTLASRLEGEQDDLVRLRAELRSVASAIQPMFDQLQAIRRSIERQIDLGPDMKSEKDGEMTMSERKGRVRISSNPNDDNFATADDVARAADVLRRMKDLAWRDTPGTPMGWFPEVMAAIDAALDDLYAISRNSDRRPADIKGAHGVYR
jgi:hypothetical protein